MSDHKFPTLKDLAQKAGVSVSSVDRVLNGRSKVRSKTKEKVLLAIDELGFQRNEAAAALAKGRPNTYRVLVPAEVGEFATLMQQTANDINQLIERHFARVEIVPVLAVETEQYLAATDPATFDGLAVLTGFSKQAAELMGSLAQNGMKVISRPGPFLSGIPVVQISEDPKMAGAKAARLMSKLAQAKMSAVTTIVDEEPSETTLRVLHSFEQEFCRQSPASAPIRKISILEAEREKQVPPVSPSLFFICLDPPRNIDQALERVGYCAGNTIVCHGLCHESLLALSKGQIDAIIYPEAYHLLIELIQSFRAKKALQMEAMHVTASRFSVFWAS